MRKSTFLAAVAVASILLPTAASAQRAVLQGAIPAEKPPTAAELDRAKAEADAALARSPVGDLFENATDDAVPTVRHKLSRMECAWDLGSEVNFQIYDGLPRGDDVSCATSARGVTYSLYATRYPQRPTAQAVVEGSVDSIRKIFTDVKPAEGTFADIVRDGDIPKITAVRLVGKLEGKPVFTRSAAVVIGDWVIAQRATGPRSEATSIDLMTGLGLTVVANKIRKDAASPATKTP